MSKTKKYELITESDINKGISKGIFIKELINLIRDNEGKIVKHLPQTNCKNDIFQPTLIQINNTYIYQTDINPIIEAIIKTKNIELFDNLDEKYHIVIDNLKYYKDHNDRLNELNLQSLEASSIFEQKIKKYLKNIDTNNFDDIYIEECFLMLNSYLNIIFIYIISTYWLHEDKISNDTIAKEKIENLNNQVKYIYEQLLAKSTFDKKDKIHRFSSLNNSPYAYYLLEENKGIYKIEEFIKYDSRFNSVTDFMDFIHRCYFKKVDSYYDRYNNYEIPTEYKFNIKIDNIDKKSKKLSFLSSLYDVLIKIEILNNNYDELIEANKINFSEISLYGKDNVDNIVLLALNKNKANKTLERNSLP